jgi:hypothetical protein
MPLYRPEETWRNRAVSVVQHGDRPDPTLVLFARASGVGG